METTIEREREVEQSPTPTRIPRRKREPKRPTVRQFKEIVMRHCHNWNALNVDGLCDTQTEVLIAELAEHFG